MARIAVGRGARGAAAILPAPVPWGKSCAFTVGLLIRIARKCGSQDRPEVRFCAEPSPACALYGAKVEGWGHLPNFVRPCIEGEHKFGGWIWQRWVPSSAVVGIDGRANVLRECYATLLLVHLRSPISSKNSVCIPLSGRLP
eukprot:COSAG02_NODE_2452_length_8826_cov_16.362668_6_plen_142_part_00